jgi:Tol biopolymer transport system component
MPQWQTISLRNEGTTMKTLTRWITAAVLTGVLAVTGAPAAESFSVLLQKGIFAEETEGNLDAAIKIYQQITVEAAANRAVAAQAQFRLAVCQQKKGDKAQAISLLNDLLKQFPSEAALGQKARALLVDLGQTAAGNITIRQLPLQVDSVMTVSPDGRFIAYMPKGSDGFAICEIATGKIWTAITGKIPNQALFSPDGRYIAYKFKSDDEPSYPIYVARIDGSEAKVVFAGTKGMKNELHDWSPDGGRLIVETWDNKTTGVGTVDIKTGALRETKRWDPPPYIRRMCLSANGRYVAFGVGKGAENQRKITVLDLESAIETTLVEREVGDVVGWAPGDAKLLFSSDRTGTKSLWAVPVREGKPASEPELVKANVNVGEIVPIGLTRDGSFYYTETKFSKDVYVAAADLQTGAISAQPRRVSDRFWGQQSDPVWSKDGQSLMFVVQGAFYVGDFQKRFIAVSMATGERKEFPVSETFRTWLQHYAWSHDRSFLLATAGRAGVGHGIHRYELATGSTEMLVKTMNSTVPGHWICHPRLSPDGDAFYYTRRDFFKGADERTDYKDSIIRRHLRSGNEEIVYASPDRLQIWWPYELSSDGKRLAVVTSDEFRIKDFVVALKVRDVDGHETRELVRMAPRENLTSLAWTPDGKRLVYTKAFPGKNQEEDGPCEVWSTAVDSGQSVELKFSQPGIRDVAIHPDGRQIAFRAGSSNVRSVWSMDGLFSPAVAGSARTTNN